MSTLNRHRITADRGTAPKFLSTLRIIARSLQPPPRDPNSAATINALLSSTIAHVEKRPRKSN